MSNLHPIFEQALKPFIPPETWAINDDDVYVVDIANRRVLRRVGRMQEMRHQTVPLAIGEALLAGMQAKHYKE